MQKLGFGKNRAVDELLYNSTNLQSTLRKAGGVERDRAGHDIGASLCDHRAMDETDRGSAYVQRR